MASQYDYVVTTPGEIAETFGKDENGQPIPDFKWDPSSLAGMMQLACIAGPKEKKWEEERLARDNGYTVRSTRVTKKSRSIEIFKKNQDKTRDTIIRMMMEELEVDRIQACDLYRWCDQNRREVFAMASPEPEDDDGEL